MIRSAWWRLADQPDFAFTMAQLRVRDWFAGPYAETAAYRHREQTGRLRRLAEQGRRSGLSDDDGEATLDRLVQRIERRRLSQGLRPRVPPREQ
jgi:hypothetical protein